MKANWAVLSYNTVYYAVYKSVHKILVCDHSSESYWVVLSCVTVYSYAVQGDLGMKP